MLSNINMLNAIVQKFAVGENVFFFFWKVTSAHQMTKNAVQIVKYYYNLKQLYSIWIYFKM